MIDFLNAALPWIIASLSFAIFFANVKKNREILSINNSYIFEGLCLAIAISFIFFSSDLGLALPEGVLIGLSLGTSIKKKNLKEKKVKISGN